MPEGKYHNALPSPVGDLLAHVCSLTSALMLACRRTAVAGSASLTLPQAQSPWQAGALGLTV